MKENIKSSVMRMALALIALFTVAGANAANRLYIENFTLNNTQPKRVAVILDNDDPVAALQCRVVAPEGVEVLSFERNDERFMPGQNPNFRAETGMLLVVSSQRNNFNGNSGAIGWLTVRASESAISSGKNGKLILQNIILSTVDGKAVECDKTTTTSVSIQNGVATLSTEEPFVINPGATHTVSLSVANDFSVRGMQVAIGLPEGFTIVNNAVEKGTRLSNGAYITVTPRADGVTYGIVVYDLASSDPVFRSGSGTVLTFEVQAPENFTAPTGEIRFSDVVFSNTLNQPIYAEGTGVAVTNGSIAYAAAQAEIAALENELAATLDKIAEVAPDVKDNFDGSNVAAMISDLKESVESAYADGTLTGNYENVMNPVQAIRDAIAQLLADAEAAQAKFAEDARVAANMAAYQSDLDKIAEIENELDITVSSLKDVCPDVDIEALAASVRELIENERVKASEAFEAVREEGSYSNEVDLEALREAIENLISEAHAEQKAIDDERARVAANEAAYQADLETIQGLQEALDSLVERLHEQYPEVDLASEIEAAQSAISLEKEKADREYESVREAGDYTNVVDVETIESMLQAIEQKAIDSGVADIYMDFGDGEVKIFTPDGICIPALQRGKVNIVVSKDGTIKKVFVR